MKDLERQENLQKLLPPDSGLMEDNDTPRSPGSTSQLRHTQVAQNLTVAQNQSVDDCLRFLQIKGPIPRQELDRMFKVKDAYIIHTKRIIETVSEYRTSMYVLLCVMSFLYAVTAFTCKSIPYYEALALICCGTAIGFGVLGAFEILGVVRDINEEFSLDSLDVVGQQQEDMSEFPSTILKIDLLDRIWWLRIWAILKIAVFCAFSFLFSWLLWCYLGYDYSHCKN